MVSVDESLPAMTQPRLTAEVVRIMSGASRDLSCPHLLIELCGRPGFSATPLAADRCRRLSRLLKPKTDEPLYKELMGAEVTAAFGCLTILIQQHAGFAVREFKVLRIGEQSARIVVEHLWAPGAELAARVALRLLDDLTGSSIISESEIRGELARYLESCSEGPRYDQRYLYEQARLRGIPVALNPPFGLQFGYGRNMRRIQRLLTDKTSFLAVRNSSNKTSTIATLHKAGLPVPEHYPVKDSAAAATAAKKIGFPVVVKPANTDRGVGITAGVMTVSGVQDAYRHARHFDQQVAVERFIPGDTFRLLVVNGNFVAASRTIPTAIVGDGSNSVRDLVATVNSGPQRGPGHQKPLTWLEIDDEAMGILKSLDLTQDSVLPFGRTIRLRSASNLSRGGLSVAVTESVHSDNRQMAERCAMAIGLDLVGIDFRTEAIDRSWRESGGCVIEVNASPGLRMHVAPAVGVSSDVASPILDLLYPDGQTGRIPLIAVTGTNGKTTTTRMIAHVLRACGYVTGRTTTEEAAVDDDIIMSGDCAGPGPARTILAIPHVEAAVLETARGALIKYGLGFGTCDVAVVTNVEADHLGELEVDSIDELAIVKQVVAQSAERAVVLNADDERCLGMRPHLTGRKIVLFSTNENNAEIARHLNTGGLAYFLVGSGEDEAIMRAERGERSRLLRVRDLPITLNGVAGHNIQNAMAALAAIEQLGLDETRVRDAAKTFLPTAACNPGRLNVIDGFPFTVILDYAHNEHGFNAIAHFVGKSRCQGRKLCVVTMNAARVTDNIAQDAMRPLAEAFDSFVTCAHRNPKKRRGGFGDILRQGLMSAGVPSECICVREDEEAAIRCALALANPGDLVMLLIGYEPRYFHGFVTSLVAEFSNRSNGLG